VNPSTILVTGGAGMIGSHLVHRLLKEGWDVSVVDNLWRGKLEYLDFPDAKFDFATRFFNRDLREAKALETLPGKYDYIVHLADIVAGIDFVFANEGAIFRDNPLINSNVVDNARVLGWKPRINLKEGLNRTYHWIEERQADLKF
jgi:GDP-D-mannose 3',5'-epimerase